MSAGRAALVQVLVVATIGVAAIGLAVIGSGSAAKLVFMAAGMVAATWYALRSPWLYLTLLLWFWTLTPFVRRMIDFHTGFDPVNVILATPNLMSLLMLRDILTSQQLLSRRETALGMLVAVPTLYGLAINLVQGDIVPGLVGAAEWIAPLCYFFYVLAHAERIRESEANFRAFLGLNAAIVAGYGLYQYWALPPWDVAWAIASGLQLALVNSLDQFRVFGTLNHQGVLAPWLVALALLALHFRDRLMMVALPAVLLLLILTLVRSTVGCLVLSLAVAAVVGRLQLKGLAVMVAAVAAVGLILTAVDATTFERLIARFDSVGSLDADDSAIVRRSIWQSAPGLIDANPFGIGIGGLGRGAVVTGAADLVSVDAGPLAIYLSLGWIAGSVYLVGMFAVVGHGLAVARRTASPAALAWAVTALSALLELPFVNVFGFTAVILWLSAGCAAAYGLGSPARAASGRSSS